MNIRKPRKMPELTDAIMRRFFRKVWRSDLTECWIWTGARNSQGYGRIKLLGDRSAFLAHRVAYAWKFGDPRPGLVLMHHCDNPTCVNPDHVSPGSPRRNTWDMIEKGRHRGGVKVLIPCPY